MSKQEEQIKALHEVYDKVDSLQKIVANCEQKANLVHLVYLKAKEEISDEEKALMKASLQSLGEIPQTVGLTVGEPAETGDPRLVSDYTFVLQMAFENESDMQVYATDSFHLKVRASLKPFLA